MNELNSEFSSELLHQFLDGELDVTKEKQLFSELAENEELRHEMRELIALRETVQSDLEAFTPPVESAGIIFSRVGLNSPIHLPGSAGHTILRRNVITGFVKKAWVPVAAAILASLMTTWFLTDKYENRLADLEKRIPTVSSYETSGSGSQNIAENGNIPDRKVYVYQKPIIIYKDRVSAASETITEEPSADNAALDQTGMADSPSIATLYASDPVNTNHLNRYTRTGNQNTYSMHPDREYKPLPIRLNAAPGDNSIVLRGIQAMSFPTADVPQESGVMMSNMSIGYYKKIKPSLKIGLEFGREPFGQEFVNTEEYVGVVYEQNPLMNWMALGFQYEMQDQIPLLMGGKPFAQLLLGGTEQGPLGKMITGLQYVSQDMGIGIMLGLEGSLLWYENQGRSYYTKKFGFTYGMSYQF